LALAGRPVEPNDEDTGWLMMSGGALAAAIGFFLIVICSLM
jgi:hypothetical protein